VKLITLLLAFLTVSRAFSQKEAEQWYFGLHCGIDFTGAAPVSNSNSAMVAPEGCASIADAGGNILFYTNGQEIWNKNHVTMANGASLAGCGSPTQSSLIIRKPASANLYYVFTLGGSPCGNPVLAYSVVDMALAAGLGSVTVKNATLGTGYNEAMHATRHCNGQDFWIAVHKKNMNDYHAFLLTSSGVNNNPVVSNSGGIVSSQVGAMKFSPAGNRLCIVNGDSLEVTEFDPATGQFMNPLFLVPGGDSYGCEFSPDGSKLYVTQNYIDQTFVTRLLQWDLCAATAVAATIYSTSSGGLETLQLGPGGQILCAQYNSLVLGAITNPNAAGSACNFVPNALPVSSGTIYGGLPNFLSDNFRQKPLVSYNTNCGTVAFSYTAPAYCSQAGDSVNSVQWLFGDLASGTANSSTLANPAHTYSANGTYTVKLIASYNCYSDTTVQTVSITALPALTVTGKTTICLNEITKFTLAGAATYSLNGNQVTNTLTVNPLTTTVYTVTGSYSNTCESAKIVTVTVKPCTFLTEEQNNKMWRVYPNPGDGNFIINLKEPAIIYVYNELGQQVKAIPAGSGEQVLDLTNLPDGIYFARNSAADFRIKLLLNR
jgi:PKD repeat protein